MKNFFGQLDVNQSGVVRRVEFQRGVDASLLEVCFEIEKVKLQNNCKMMGESVSKACERRVKDAKKTGRALTHETNKKPNSQTVKQRKCAEKGMAFYKSCENSDKSKEYCVAQADKGYKLCLNDGFDVQKKDKTIPKKPIALQYPVCFKKGETAFKDCERYKLYGDCRTHAR